MQLEPSHNMVEVKVGNITSGSLRALFSSYALRGKETAISNSVMFFFVCDRAFG